MPTAQNHSFNVLLSPDEFAQLTYIARHNRRSRGAVIRESIRSHYLMITTSHPLCATGARCTCPQIAPIPSTIHPYPTAPAPEPTTQQHTHRGTTL